MPGNMEAREAHYARFFGPLGPTVYHSNRRFNPHIDIYPYPPSGQRDYWTLITGGMSDRAQRIPKIARGEISPFTEVVMYAHEVREWMVGGLSALAEHPFREKTFLHLWHSFGTGAPLFEGSIFAGFVCLPPIGEREDFDSLCLPAGKVDFLWAVPVTAAELEFKITNGAEALMHLFQEHDLDMVVDEERQSMV
jgi:hypothetical protein